MLMVDPTLTGKTCDVSLTVARTEIHWGCIPASEEMIYSFFAMFI